MVFQHYRNGFYAGLLLAGAIGVFLVWLWRPAHQVQRHTDNLLKAIEHRKWTLVEHMIALNYEDQWHNDRALLLERMRFAFVYAREIKLTPELPIVWTDHGTWHWQSRIKIDGQPGEGLTMIQERVNFLTSPFVLEWQHVSSKPWDWKLVRASNTELAIPEFAE